MHTNERVGGGGVYLLCKKMYQMKTIEGSRHGSKLLTKTFSMFLGTLSGSCRNLARPAQSPRCPAGDWDRAAEAGGQTHKSVFHWNPHGEYCPAL